jgi:hypothetical protein
VCHTGSLQYQAALQSNSVEKWFLFTWTYSVVVLNCPSLGIQEAFVYMKHNKNKPRMITQIPANLWNKKLITCENICAKKNLA